MPDRTQSTLTSAHGYARQPKTSYENEKTIEELVAQATQDIRRISASDATMIENLLNSAVEALIPEALALSQGIKVTRAGPASTPQRPPLMFHMVTQSMRRVSYIWQVLTCRAGGQRRLGAGQDTSIVGCQSRVYFEMICRCHRVSPEEPVSFLSSGGKSRTCLGNACVRGHAGRLAREMLRLGTTDSD
jgi:hypothetical protein